MNNKRYWVRGGIVFLIVEVINAVTILWDVDPFGGYFGLELNYVPNMLIGIFNSSFIPFNVTLYLLYGFVLGSLLGWLFGKIKNNIRKPWLRGGIIGVLLYGIITLILIPFGSTTSCWICFPYWTMPTLIVYPISSWLMSLLPMQFQFYGGGQPEIRIAAILYFILGMIIGWVYGLIKTKRKNNQELH